MLRNLHKPFLWYPKFWYSLLQTAGIKMAFDEYWPTKLNETKGPVIIMHCITGSKENWEDFSRKVCEQTNRTFYCVDARNHGKSPFTKEHGSSFMSGDVEEFVKDHNLKRVSVMGNGSGGRAMMLFALKHPSLVESAIIVDICPVAVPQDYLSLDQIFLIIKGVDIPKTHTVLEGRTMMEEMFIKVVGNENAKCIANNLNKNDKGDFFWNFNVDALRENLRPFSDFRDHLRQDVKPCDKPAMFVCGKHSNFVDTDSFTTLKYLFSKNEMHWLDDGHLVYCKQPEILKELVINFLKKT